MTDEAQNPTEEKETEETSSEPSVILSDSEGSPEDKRDSSSPEEPAPQNDTSEEASAPESTEPVYKSKLENFDDLKPGQTVRLHERIKDISPKGEERERIQVFEGIILGLKGAGVSRTLTIRKVSSGGYAVEKIFPINSPVIAKIELVKSAKVRRAKLNFLKNVERRFKRKLKETQA